MTDFTKLLNDKLRMDMVSAAELLEKAATLLEMEAENQESFLVARCREQAKTLRVDADTLLVGER